MTDKTRERFEAWAKVGGYDLVKDDYESYISTPTIFAWMGYKTASAERDAEADAWKSEAEESRNRLKIERDDHRDYCERLIRSGESVAKTKDKQINNLAAEIEQLRAALIRLLGEYVDATYGPRTCDCDKSIGHGPCAPCEARAALAAKEKQ